MYKKIIQNDAIENLNLQCEIRNLREQIEQAISLIKDGRFVEALKVLE